MLEEVDEVISHAEQQIPSSRHPLCLEVCCFFRLQAEKRHANHDCFVFALSIY